MDDQGLIARDVALLKHAQGIGAQKSYIGLFFIAAVMVCVALVGIISGGVVGIGLAIAVIGVGAVAHFTTFGDNLIIGVLVLISLAVAALALYGAVTSVL